MKKYLRPNKLRGLHRRFFLVLFILLVTPHAHAKLAGQARLDSLLKELPRQKEDTNKVRLLFAISWGYGVIRPEEGITYGQQCMELAKRLGWKKGIAAANNCIGNSYLIKSDYSKALDCFMAKLKICEEINHKPGIAGAFGNIGNVYNYQGNYSKALEFYLKDLKMEEEMGDKEGMAIVTGNIGSLYERQSNYPKALEYQFKSLRIDEELGDKKGMAYVTGNIGNIYNAQKDYAKALEYFFEGLKMYEDMGDKRGVAISFTNIGAVYAGKDDYAKSLEYALKSLKMSEELDDKKGIAIATMNIGDNYRSLHDYSRALEYDFKALKMSEELADNQELAFATAAIGKDYLHIVSDPSISPKRKPTEPSEMPYVPDGLIPSGKNAILHKAVEYLNKAITMHQELGILNELQKDYESLSIADSLLGDFRGAFAALMQHHFYQDSVFSKKNSVKITRLEMQKKAEADSLKHAQERLVAELKYRQQRNYTYLGAAGILALLGFSVFIVRERTKSDKERKKSDSLLLNILPQEVAHELKTTGTSEPKDFDNVTILFTDFVSFTQASEKMSPKALIDELHTCFKAFDEITVKYNIEKIKTIGDAYLAIAGLPTANPKHAENVVSAAIEINKFMSTRYDRLGERTFQVRIGIHTGSVVAGIVGVKKFAYDIWGDTVNTAARMEQSSEPGKINISESTYDLVKDKFHCEYRGEIEAKNKGKLKMYYVG